VGVILSHVMIIVVATTVRVVANDTMEYITAAIVRGDNASRSRSARPVVPSVAGGDWVFMQLPAAVAGRGYGVATTE